MEKSSQFYSCEICDYSTSKYSNFIKHTLTRKHQKRTFLNEKVAKKSSQKITNKRKSKKCCKPEKELCKNDTEEKSSKRSKFKNTIDSSNISHHNTVTNEIKQSKYNCSFCNYSTNRKYNYKKHCETKRHITREKQHMECKDIEHSCVCGKTYKVRNSLWYHMKKCPKMNNTIVQYEEVGSNVDPFIATASDIKSIVSQNKQLLEKNDTLINQNQELMEKLADVAMQPKVVNNQFNLMNYLNTECADAMDMSEFIDSIEVTNESLYLTCQKGFRHAFEKLFIDALEEVGEKRRPLHCTDKKRKRFVVKEDGVWQREEDGNPILDRAMHGLNDKQFMAMQQWKTYHPDWLDRDDFLDFTNNLTQELCMIYQVVKKKKIVGTIANNVFINKSGEKI